MFGSLSHFLSKFYFFHHHQDHFSVSDELRANGHPKLASDLRIMWEAEKQSKDQRMCIRLVKQTANFNWLGFVHIPLTGYVGMCCEP